jgi:hypothetical protein
LCGMTDSGGRDSVGNIFTIHTDGSNFTDIFDFSVTNGSSPNGNLILSNGIFYGMTEEGGTNFYKGLLFSFKVTDLGINNLNTVQNQIGVYPNPSTGIFNLQVKSEEVRNMSVEVFNVLGERVLKQILRSAQDDKVIDLGAEPDGVYFYRVLNEDGGLVGEGKLVIQK